MAYIEKRANGTYRVRVRRRGYPPQTATFSTLSDAKKWAYITEGDVLADRHFPSTVSKKHTVSDLIQRYVRDVLPRKSSSSQYIQGLQFVWWDKQIGHYTLSYVTPDYSVQCVRFVLMRLSRLSPALHQNPGFDATLCADLPFAHKVY